MASEKSEWFYDRFSTIHNNLQIAYQDREVYKALKANKYTRATIIWNENVSLKIPAVILLK